MLNFKCRIVIKNRNAIMAPILTKHELSALGGHFIPFFKYIKNFELKSMFFSLTALDKKNYQTRDFFLAAIYILDKFKYFKYMLSCCQRTP